MNQCFSRLINCKADENRIQIFAESSKLHHENLASQSVELWTRSIKSDFKISRVTQFIMKRISIPPLLLQSASKSFSNWYQNLNGTFQVKNTFSVMKPTYE